MPSTEPHDERAEVRRRAIARLRPQLPTRGWRLLAAVCAVALLISFGRTVQLVVAQGNERRAQDLQTAQTLGRCNTIASRQARDECRATAR